MLSEQYPRALQRLHDAADARVAAVDAWNTALEGDFFDAAVSVSDDGSGTILIWANWPADLRAQMTAWLRDFVTALWDALDELVRESVEMFAVQHSVRDPDARRYFPIAIDERSFADLLETSCINGVLRSHGRLITISQPFMEDDDPIGVRVRRGLRRLLDWTHQLDNGAAISAWVTPESPEVLAEPPAAVESVTVAAPSEVTDAGVVVAQFKLQDHRAGMRHLGRPGTWLDPFMPGDTPPATPDDHFNDRARACERAVRQIVVQFDALSERVPVARSLLAPPVDPSTPARTARSMGTEEADALRASESKVALVVDERGTRSIVVATPDGFLQRDIPLPSSLRAYKRTGDAAEIAVRDAVATWGLPDFAMQPRVERKGSGVREVGDGLVLTGDRGLIVQVKQREDPSGNAEKEDRWVTKNIKKACRQIDGTYRRLAARTTNFTNGRGTELRIDTTKVAFCGVVIVDHPDNSVRSRVEQPATHIPTVVITRRDWEFLFNQLRSTRAVVDYLFRIESSTEHLHEEPARYYELAVLDAATPPNPPSPHHAGFSRFGSIPQLPLNPVGADDPVAHGMFRLIAEDIATMPLGAASAEDIVDALAMIDGLHVSARVELGRLLLESLAQEPDSYARSWRFRTIAAAQPGDPQLTFGTCAKFDEITEAGFRSWIELRHHQRAEVEDISNAVTVGVLLTRRRDEVRGWDTTLMVARGDLQLKDEEVKAYEKLWGPRGSVGSLA